MIVYSPYCYVTISWPLFTGPHVRLYDSKTKKAVTK